MKINLYDLKNAVDAMIYQHENRLNAMSDRINILETEKGIELNQICEYPECYPRKTLIERID